MSSTAPAVLPVSLRSTARIIRRSSASNAGSGHVVPASASSAAPCTVGASGRAAQATGPRSGS